MPKPCPESVIKAGGALVLLRHKLQALDKDFARAHEALDATGPDLKAAGMKGMSYGVAKANLYEAQRAAGLVMAAHEHMANAVCACDMDTPTDAQLVGIVGTLNWR